MNAYDIIKLVMWAITVLISLSTLHFGIFGIIGVFAKKTYPKAKNYHKFGIIIPARNEESVVAGLIESCYKNDYPQDMLHVFVIAHNCTDKTAEVARKLGATVYEYNNENEKTMGYAFRHLFSKIEEDYGTQNYDGFILFNADNILSKNYFEKMNDAFEAEGCTNIVTSFRNSKNFGTNYMSAMYGIHFATGCRLEARGRTVCNCSTRVQGTGYVIPAEIVKDGWKYVTLTEDWEFSADQIIQGRKIKYCDEAIFYDEQPTDFKVMWRQRVRWAKGHLLVCLTRWWDLFKKIFSRKKVGQYSNRVSAFDLMVNISPLGIIYTVLSILQLILTIIAPLIAHVDPANIWIDYAVSLCFSFGSGAVGAFFLAIAVFILEHKRIKNVPLGVKIGAVFFAPIFQLLITPMQIVALFSRNLEWKTIPHSDQTNFDQLNVVEGAEETTPADETVEVAEESVAEDATEDAAKEN